MINYRKNYDNKLRFNSWIQIRVQFLAERKCTLYATVKFRAKTVLKYQLHLR